MAEIIHLAFDRDVVPDQRSRRKDTAIRGGKENKFCGRSTSREGKRQCRKEAEEFNPRGLARLR